MWQRRVAAADQQRGLVKLTRRLLAEGGVGQFVEALAGAQPPTLASQQAPTGFATALARQQRFATERGSNAVAVGAQRSANGRGLLLANPHFPWMGGLRFTRCS